MNDPDKWRVYQFLQTEWGNAWAVTPPRHVPAQQLICATGKDALAVMALVRDVADWLGKR